MLECICAPEISREQLLKRPDPAMMQRFGDAGGRGHGSSISRHGQGGGGRRSRSRLRC